jgi:hypothetical protein
MERGLGRHRAATDKGGPEEAGASQGRKGAARGGRCSEAGAAAAHPACHER